FGTMAHEIGHAMGFWHEHARPDRDDHIKVVYNQISSTKQSQFSKQNWVNTKSYGVDYDVGSVMHYHSKSFTKAGQLTIKTINPLYQRTIGQRVALSFADVKVANMAYCAGKCPQPSSLLKPCLHGGYQDPKACDRCRCPDGLAGTYCDQVAPPKIAECGGEVIAESMNTVHSQSIESPGYNLGQYDNGQECSWLIKAPAGSRVVLYFVDTFRVFITASSNGKSCFHWVEVKYKNNKEQTGPRFCGYSTPSERVESEGSEMLVLLRANHTVSRYKRFGFKARFYAEPIDECANAPCGNGSTCIDDINDYTCECLEGFTGKNCDEQIEVDICAARCLNGGTCTITDSGDGFECTCTPGFTGTTCEIAMPTPAAELETTPGQRDGRCPEESVQLPGGKCEVAVISEWSSWSECSSNCGGCGLRYRSRRITTSLFGKVNTESKPCNIQRCAETNDCASRRICDAFPHTEQCKRPCPRCCQGFHEDSSGNCILTL
ncbi:unnamed protein product, partial [Owenia fusiformis]